MLRFFKNFRGEVEGSYSELNYDDVDGTLTLTYGGSSISSGGSVPVDGDVGILDIYLNLIYDGEPTIYQHIAPFFGFGIGLSHIDEEVKTIGHPGEQLTVNTKEKSTDGGIQLLFEANLINFGNNFPSGFRLVGRHL